MRIRCLLAAAALVGTAAVAAGAPGAAASCDPRFHPLCVCNGQPPTDPRQLDDWLLRLCPH